MNRKMAAFVGVEFPIQSVAFYKNACRKNVEIRFIWRIILSKIAALVVFVIDVGPTHTGYQFDLVGDRKSEIQLNIRVGLNEVRPLGDFEKRGEAIEVVPLVEGNSGL